MDAQQASQTPSKVSSATSLQSGPRFQLLAAEYETAVVSPSSGTMISTKGLFRIDTATGQVWKYSEIVQKGTSGIMRWELISEN